MKSVRKQSMPRVFLAFLTLVAAQMFASCSSAQSKLVKQPQGTNVPEQLFKDVPLGDQSYRAIALLLSQNIVVGYPRGYFSGKRVLTRFEFAVALDNVRLPSAAARNPLEDESVALYHYLSDQFRPELTFLGKNHRTTANQGVPTEETVSQFIKRSNELPVLQPFALENNRGS